MGAHSEIGGSIDDREVEECAILGNRIAWRNRVLFSQGFGDMVFASGKGLI